jgi:glyoxylate reductase
MSEQSTSPVVVVTRRVPGEIEIPGVLVRMGTGELSPREKTLQMVAGAAVVVTMFTDRVDDAFLDAAGAGLKGVCNFAVGHDNIDLDACRHRGVIVTNSPDVVTEGTADMAWALILAVARRMVLADRYARSEAYPAHGPLGMDEMLGADLTGRTLLIVGAGRIGFATAMRSIGWGMRVLYVARSRHWDFELAPLAAQRVTLEEGLERADVVSIHTPLTDETRHLIDGRAIDRMKRGAILVNTSRGPVIDEGALAAALKAERIWGAGLDVYENEPVIHPDLIGLDNAVLMPHIGSAEKRYREMMTQMVAQNASAILGGREPPNRIA